MKLPWDHRNIDYDEVSSSTPASLPEPAHGPRPLEFLRLTRETP